MGKPTGFMEYQRKTGNTVAPLERIKNFKEFSSAAPEKGAADAGCPLYGMRCTVLPGGNHDCGNGLRLSAAEPRSGVE